MNKKELFAFISHELSAGGLELEEREYGDLYVRNGLFGLSVRIDQGVSCPSSIAFEQHGAPDVWSLQVDLQFSLGDSDWGPWIPYVNEHLDWPKTAEYLSMFELGPTEHHRTPIGETQLRRILETFIQRLVVGF